MAERLTAKALNAACPYATDGEIDWLQAWAREQAQEQRSPAWQHRRPPPRAVIIGCGPGVMALALLEANPDIDLYVVENDTFHWFDEHLKQAGLGELAWTALLGESEDIGPTWDNGPIDLLIIDGDHSEEGVIADIRGWWPHVRSGGTVVFDDYYRVGAEWDGVRSGFAKEMAQRNDWQTLAAVDSFTVLKKL